MTAPTADATPETISAELTDAPLSSSTTSEDAEQIATSIAVVPSSGPGGNALEAVEEAVVPFAVDQAGTRALQLMAHAAGAPDLHIERFVIAFDRLADRLAEHEAAPA